MIDTAFGEDYNLALGLYGKHKTRHLAYWLGVFCCVSEEHSKHFKYL